MLFAPIAIPIPHIVITAAIAKKTNVHFMSFKKNPSEYDKKFIV